MRLAEDTTPGLARAHKPRSSRLELIALGLDYTSADVSLRERLAFAPAEIPTALQRLTDPGDPLLEQAAILSTCNRTEVYGVARSWVSRHTLLSFLARYHGIAPDALAGAVFVHRGDGVPHRLASTAAGMKSLVLGEAQIQGQVRTALDYALAAGTAGPELRRLFESAIAAGRRVRVGTALGRGVASVPQASVEFARRRVGTLTSSTVLLIGAGTTAELAAKHLTKHQTGELLILGRNRTRAEQLAERHGARVICAERVDEALARTDLVISSTGAPCPILHRDQVQQALARRQTNSAPLVMIDLAVPRDIEPAVAELDGVELYTIDDLQTVVEQTLTQRSAELPAAYSIVRAEVARFTEWLWRREVAASRRAAT